MNNWQSNVKYIGERMPYTLDCQLFIVNYNICFATSHNSSYHSLPKRRMRGSFKNW